MIQINAEAHPENEKKKTEVSQKAGPTKNIEEKAPDKTKLNDAQKQKEKRPRLKVTRSKDYPEIRNLRNQIYQEGPQVPNQINETMHQRQPPPSNANTTEQPPVQAEGNNEQRETETREPVSGNQISESGKTGPLTTP
ncbi:Hypothetical_protein [Hexamita inflata]|uniref:Hypothetical_protein n=1 Tax=Hexamita inflata TaxID=28002 RepID=A0ABP1I401_9EUKA